MFRYGASVLTLNIVLIFCVVEGVYYYSKDDKEPWESARQKCRDKDMMLAKLDSIDAVSSAVTYIQSVKSNIDKDIWIGMFYDAVSNVYRWRDEENATYFQWAANEPNNKALHPCIELDSKGNFKSRTESCSEKNEFLCTDAAVPQVTADSVFETTMYYGTITLNCPFFSVIDIIDVWWSFTNEIYNVTITSTTDTTKYRGADVSNPAIRIYNIDETNVGFYSCHVTNSQGEGIGPPIEVLIVDFPRLSIPQEEYTAIYGDNLTIQCSYYGMPEVTLIKWLIYYPDNTMDTYSGENFTVFAGSTLDFPSLVIKKVTFLNEAQYVCEATNSVGSTTGSRIDLTVYGVITEIAQEEYTEVYGSTVTIGCTVLNSVPTLTHIEWTWESNGTITTIDKYNTNKYSGASITEPSLTIMDVLFTDRGKYYCSGSNSETYGISKGALLMVTGDIPKVSTRQTTVRVQQSQSITIFCETSGEPHVTSVFWTKNGAPLVTNATVATPSLTMRSVSPDDNGLYICNAQNAVGTTASVGVKVEVSTDDLCTCSCEYRSKLDYWATQNVTNMTLDELREVLAPILKEIRANLTVDVKELTMTKLKFTSAHDNRQSAGQIGLVGIVFLVLSFGSLVFIDILNFYEFAKNRLRRLI